MSERIVILANSRKHSGRCVAGKTYDGSWIRLVKNSENCIPTFEALNYTMLKILDISAINNKASREFNYHTENSTYSTVRNVGYFNRAELDDILDEPLDIFGSGKRITTTEAQRLNNSLLFLKVKDFQIYVKDCGQYGQKLRCQFSYRNNFYTDIAVTDSATESRLASKVYPFEEDYKEAYITVSLGEVFDGYAYKLVSGIIIP